MSAGVGKINSSMWRSRVVGGAEAPNGQVVYPHHGIRNRRWGWCLWALVPLAIALTLGCQKSPTERGRASGAQGADDPRSDKQARVLLEGAFAAVTKSASGFARIVVEDGRYRLELENVSLEDDALTRVYLVGLSEAMSSAAVDQVELKYDMGALQKPDQRIELPSRPDAALRCVVLWNPRYKANLAAASLRPPG